MVILDVTARQKYSLWRFYAFSKANIQKSAKFMREKGYYMHKMNENFRCYLPKMHKIMKVRKINA